jgi:hypothetical protein
MIVNSHTLVHAEDAGNGYHGYCQHCGVALETNMNWSSWTGVKCIDREVENYNDIPAEIRKADELIFRVDSADAITSSADNITWETVTGITVFAGDVAYMGSTYYMNDNDITIDASADGIAFVPMTNQPSAVGLLSASATTLVTTLEIAPVEDVTGISYAYAAGDVAWAAGGTSTITGKTNLSDIQTMYFGGKFHTICYENNLSAAFYETSVDEGANWVDASSEIDAGTIPTGFTSDGTTMYMTLITIATFTAYVMTTTDGTTWNTPVILAADRMASGISGKD